MPPKTRAPYQPFEYLEAGTDYREFTLAKELERRREAERWSPVWVGLHETGQDPPGARPEHRIRAHRRAGLLPLGPRGHR